MVERALKRNKSIVLKRLQMTNCRKKRILSDLKMQM